MNNPRSPRKTHRKLNLTLDPSCHSLSSKKKFLTLVTPNVKS